MPSTSISENQMHSINLFNSQSISLRNSNKRLRKRKKRSRQIRIARAKFINKKYFQFKFGIIMKSTRSEKEEVLMILNKQLAIKSINQSVITNAALQS